MTCPAPSGSPLVLAPCPQPMLTAIWQVWSSFLPPCLTPSSGLCPVHLWKLSFPPGHSAPACVGQNFLQTWGLLSSSLPQPCCLKQQKRISRISGGQKTQNQGRQCSVSAGSLSLAHRQPPSHSVLVWQECELWASSAWKDICSYGGQSLTPKTSVRLCPRESRGRLGLQHTNWGGAVSPT